jgi:mannose-6-phosphate isomerase-like protein (cupin superfamily)
LLAIEHDDTVTEASVTEVTSQEVEMAHQGQEIVNPRTGQRLTFTELSPELLRIESLNPVSEEREPLHVHPRQHSGAEILSGSLLFEVDGVQRRLAAGESISIAAGTSHRFWNEGPGDARSIQRFEPALGTAAFFETFFALAAAGELDAKGMPRPLQLAVLVPEFADEIRPVSPPWPVLKALATVLGPIARRRGYRPRLTL